MASRAWAILVLVLISSLPATAGPIGRKTAAEHRWSVGAVVSGEDLDMKGGASYFTGNLRSNIALGEAAYAFTPDAEFVLRLGVSDDVFRFAAVNTIDLGAKMAWGIGVRGVMYESWRGWRLIGDAQYFSRPGHHYQTADIDIRDVQVAGAVEMEFGSFRPYVGFYAGRLDMTSNNDRVFLSQRNKNSFGGYLGLGLEATLEWSAFSEVRLLNGTAFSGGLSRRF